MATFVGNATDAFAQGGCYVCHRGDRLISTDAQIEGEGILVICRGCVQDLAEAAKLTFNEAYVHELELARQEDARRYDQDHVEGLEAQVHQLQQALEVSQKVESRLQAALAERKAAK